MRTNREEKRTRGCLLALWTERGHGESGDDSPLTRQFQMTLRCAFQFNSRADFDHSPNGDDMAGGLKDLGLALWVSSVMTLVRLYN